MVFEELLFWPPCQPPLAPRFELVFEPPAAVSFACMASIQQFQLGLKSPIRGCEVVMIACMMCNSIWELVMDPQLAFDDGVEMEIGGSGGEIACL